MRCTCMSESSGDGPSSKMVPGSTTISEEIPEVPAAEVGPPDVSRNLTSSRKVGLASGVNPLDLSKSPQINSSADMFPIKSNLQVSGGPHDS